MTSYDSLDMDEGDDDDGGAHSQTNTRKRERGDESPDYTGVNIFETSDANTRLKRAHISPEDDHYWSSTPSVLSHILQSGSVMLSNIVWGTNK